ncbi:MAG: SDR family oxidoreductase [Blastocatellia bacterium]|nr:SDR family oxidoreductase [Blastocatellia bacterium]
MNHTTRVVETKDDTGETERKKTAVITGASQGIGASLVTAFRDRGYGVVANSRNINDAHPFDSLSDIVLVDGDIGQPATAKRVTETAMSHFGSIDVLVNNAGIFLSKPFTQYTEEDFTAFISTNVAGFFFISQLAAGQMIKQKSGSIVNISSTLVDQPLAGLPTALPILTKGALHAVTRGLAIEYVAQGIRVNAVSAGIIDTPMNPREAHAFLKALEPMGRLGEIDEIVHAVLYLTEATFVTGEVLHVDGGQHAGRW